MKRVLFVDDEQHVLDGLRNLLRRQRRVWHMSFAQGGSAALEMLASAPYDVIITDMRMPGIDGAALLKRVCAEYPGIVRIVLSGYTEMEATLRMVSVAHQFLSKPCEPERLINVVERSCRLRSLIDNEAIQKAVGKIDTLPSLPRLYSQLVQTLMNPRVGTRDVARVLEQDMSMCAKLLQLVNSSFFRLGRRITSVEQAITHLGFNQVKGLVLSVEIFRSKRAEKRIKGFSVDVLFSHVLLAANIARAMNDNSADAEDAFTATIFHDIGQLIFALGIPDYVSEVRTLCEKGISMHKAERDLYGVTHAEVGAYLVGLWGLPYPVVEAVAHHHAPSAVPQNRFGLLGIVHVADVLAYELFPAQAIRFQDESSHRLDMNYLRSLGVADRVDAWRKLAKDTARSPGQNRYVA